MSIMLSVDIGSLPKSNMGRKARNPEAPKRGSGLYKANSAFFWINEHTIVSEIQKTLLGLAFGPRFYDAQTRAMTTALRPVHAQALSKIPRPGTPRMFKHTWGDGRETQLGEYGKTGNLATAFIVHGNPRGKPPGAKIGIDRKFGSKVRRGREIVNSRPAFYAHLVELGFVAKSRVPGIVGRRKIPRAMRGKRTTVEDVIKYFRQLKNRIASAQKKVGKVAQAQYRNQTERTTEKNDAQAKLVAAQKQMDKSLYGQTDKGKGARIKLTEAKRIRLNRFFSKTSRQKKTRVPGKFFLRDAWDQNAAKVAQIYLAHVTAEYRQMILGLAPPSTGRPIS